MAYPGQPPYNGEGTRRHYPEQMPQASSFSTYQPHIPVSLNGYRSFDPNIRPANTQQGPRHGPVHGSQQHRPLNPPQQAQRAPQRAFAVAIPPPQNHPQMNVRVSNSHDVSTSCPAHTAPPQNALNGTHGIPSKSSQHIAPMEPPLDYQLLLLSLAEEYFAAAHGYGSMADIVQRDTDVQTYYKLIATGLGCLETVLKHYKLAPEREAVVRLKYATILYEETDNTMEAEEALSKGISICDRQRLFDLRYNMQHLLARVLFSKNHRAAFKFLDGVIKDTEVYQHVAWVYAFRFLRVSLHLELSTHQDLLSTLNQLKAVTGLSNKYGDKTVLAIATTMEALTYLRVSNDAENTENAQRALATVRSLQLDPKIGQIKQLAVLTSVVDLCCHLQNFEPIQALAKMQAMQTALANPEESDDWKDEPFAIPISRAGMPFCNAQDGIVRRQDDDCLTLMFNWMPKEDIYNLGYLLSGVALSTRNAGDGQKSEHMLEEGIKRLQYANHGLAETPKSVLLALSQQLWREKVTCYMRLHLAFTLCARTSWSAAKKQELAIQNFLGSMAATSDPTPEPILLLSSYLEAVICQGTGDLDKALKVYQSEILSIPTYRKTPHPSHLHLDIVLLSALNTLLIIGTQTHPQNHQFPTLISFLEHLCLRNTSRQIQSAYHLITATMTSSSTILLTKQALQSALQTAKQSDNKQLMCMVLNFMSWKFFRGVVGEQAEKSARASQTLAQKCMDSLWICVAAGTLGDTLEAAGRIEEARRERENGLAVARGLPEGLQLAMSRDRESGNVAMLDDGPFMVGDGA